MKTYNKPPKTFDEQIQILEDRGMVINDRTRTRRHLSNVSYYRISAYMLPFKKRDCSQDTGHISVKSLEGYNQPLGISEFEGINLLPEDYKHSLPSIEEIERSL